MNNTYFAQSSSYMEEPTANQQTYIGSSESSKTLGAMSKKEAVPYIKKMRESLASIFDSVYAYIKSNKELIISDVGIITGSPDITNLHITVYGNNVFKHSNNLTNAIFNENKDDPLINTVQMRTIVEKEEFKIDYGTKTIVHMFSLAPYNPNKPAWNYTKAIVPKVINGYPYLPPEIEIMDLYDKLIVDGEDKDKLALESTLYNMQKEVSGGSLGKSCADIKRELVDIVKISVVQEWLAGRDDVVLLGSWAYNLWKLGSEKLCINPDRVQITSIRKTSDLISSLTHHIRDIMNVNIQIEVSDIHELNLPKEFRTQRTIVSVIIPSSTGIKEKPFLEIFNYITHTPVPSIKLEDKYFIAGKWVICRFTFADIWSMDILEAYGKIDAELYKKRLSALSDLIANVRSNYPKPTHVIGTFEEYAVSRTVRSKMLSSIKRFGPYIPYQQMKKSNALRNI
jgi:hypothetical protein